MFDLQHFALHRPTAPMSRSDQVYFIHLEALDLLLLARAAQTRAVTKDLFIVLIHPTINLFA